MAFAAGIIAPATAFTSVEDRLTFALCNTYTYTNRGIVSAETLSEGSRKSLAEVRHYITEYALFLEKSGVIAPILINLNLLVKTLMQVELYYRGSRRYASYKAALEELTFAWRGAEDVHHAFKALPPFSEFECTRPDPLTTEQKARFACLYRGAVDNIRAGNPLSASESIAAIVQFALTLNRSVPEINLLVYKLRLLTLFVLSSKSDWLTKYYSHKPEELMEEAKEILTTLYAL
jgi:hypothetical protein